MVLVNDAGVQGAGQGEQVGVEESIRDQLFLVPPECSSLA